MTFFDLPLSELESYYPHFEEPAGFDAFWKAALADAQAFPISVEVAEVESPFDLLRFSDVSFAGYDGQVVKAWLVEPVNSSNAPLPCVVEYIGYGGGRGMHFSRTQWALAGFAQLVMDTRGQGGDWQRSDTPDMTASGMAPHTDGKLTLGVESPDSYYYKRLYIDAVRAIEAAKVLPGVDAEQIFINGASQGGGVALAAGALASCVKGAVIEVPFLCHFKRASEITDAAPYNEIKRYLKLYKDRVEQTFATLRFFDGVYFATRSSAPALFSCGLMDYVCPPSTVYAAFNRYAGPRQIKTYEYSGHEGGAEDFVLEKVGFLRSLVAE